MMPENGLPESVKMIVHIDKDLEDLIPGYLENRRQDAHALQVALKGGDYETIRMRGHSMKGSGGGYGFDTITEIGKSLEQAAKEEDNTTIVGEIGKLRHYLDKIQVVYD